MQVGSVDVRDGSTTDLLFACGHVERDRLCHSLVGKDHDCLTQHQLYSTQNTVGNQ